MAMLGKFGLGSVPMQYSERAQPWLNLYRGASEIAIFVQSTNKVYKDLFPAWWPEQDAPPSEQRSSLAFTDPDTMELNNPLDSSVTSFTFQTMQRAIGVRHVVKFDGTADLALSQSDDEDVSANRIEYTATALACEFEFTNIDHDDPPRNFRVVEEAYETLLDSGEVFHPEWLANMAKSCGLIRMFGWREPNQDQGVLRFSDIPTTTCTKWSNLALRPGLKGQAPIEIMVKAANRMQSRLWICIPTYFGFDKHWEVRSGTKEADPTMTCPGHNFANDEEVIFYRGTWPPDWATLMSGPGREIANANIGAGTFELNGTVGGSRVRGNQTGLRSWASGDGSVQITSPGRNTVSITEATNANPAVFTAAGHNFQDGDVCVPATSGYPADWVDLARQKRAVSNVANTGTATASFQLAGINSTEYSDFINTFVWAITPMVIADMKAQTTLLIEEIEEHIDERARPIFYEWTNETWNPGFNQFAFVSAIAHDEGITNDNVNFMHGYMSAAHMHAIHEFYDPENRDKWRGVMATHLTSAGASEDRFLGAQAYIDDNELDLTVGPESASSTNHLFDYLAITGYYGNGLYTAARKSLLFGWMDDSEAAHLSDPVTYPTIYTLYDQRINEEIRDGRHIGITSHVEGRPATYTTQKNKANQWNVGLTMYEGGNHSDPIGLWNACNETEKTRLMDFFEHSNNTQLDGENAARMFELAIEAGVEFPNISADTFGPNRNGCWGIFRFLGDENPKFAAVVAANADATLRTAPKTMAIS